MNHVSKDSILTLDFTFTWKSSHATHKERYLAKNVNLIRDTLPLGIQSKILGLREGDSVEMEMNPSEVPPYKPGKVLDMPLSRFQPPVPTKPRIGRYYPKHFISDVPGTRPDSTTPFRVVKRDSSSFKADLNHPLANREVTIKAYIREIHPAGVPVGKLTRWPESIFQGPGMQARLPETPTDYLGDDPFLRENDNEDAVFYERTQATQLLDSEACHNIQDLYTSLLSPEMTILDLMAGSQSHLPESYSQVVGLGVSASEMHKNTSLDQQIVHDLNIQAELPMEDAQFDAIICSASVEYLTKPFEIFEEVARILRPDGLFIVTFSNNWFDQKVIQIWTELNDFERMGLVSQFFVRTNKFNHLTTFSQRGWPRPMCDDADACQHEQSDPVFAVWGRKKSA